jgi:hypothetical protein
VRRVDLATRYTHVVDETSLKHISIRTFHANTKTPPIHIPIPAHSISSENPTILHLHS